MPARTDDFQHLVFLINTALSGTVARVSESAMMPNRAAKNIEEIDVLVEMPIGRRIHRTAIACQDRSRKAGPDWIRSLVTQRGDIRVDKFIAVTSEGFSKSAIHEANSHGIDVIHASEIDRVDWAKSSLPDCDTLIGMSKAQFEGLTLGYAPGPPTPGENVKVDKINFPDGSAESMQSVQTRVTAAVRSAVLRDYDPSCWTGWQHGKTSVRGVLYEVRVQFMSECVVRTRRGDAPIGSLVAYSKAGIELTLSETLELRRYGDSMAKHQAAEVYGVPFRAAIVYHEQAHRISCSLNRKAVAANGIRVEMDLERLFGGISVVQQVSAMSNVEPTFRQYVRRV